MLRLFAALGGIYMTSYTIPYSTIKVITAYIYPDYSAVFDCEVHVVFNITLLLTFEK